MSRPKTNTQSFWRKFTKGNGCWEWPGSLSKSGYGQISVGDKMWRSHRYAYTVSKGPIPDGMFVLHKCDNRKCCKPWHLYRGDQQQNMDDMKKRNRHKPHVPRGEIHSDSKLTEADVVEIRGRRENGELLREIAEDFPVDYTYISRICLRKTWSHI